MKIVTRQKKVKNNITNKYCPKNKERTKVDRQTTKSIGEIICIKNSNGNIINEKTPNLRLNNILKFRSSVC